MGKKGAKKTLKINASLFVQLLPLFLFVEGPTTAKLDFHCVSW
jgi:hypothetical protein